MEYIFIFLCFLLLFYKFETTALLGSNKYSHMVLVWKIIEKKYLLQICPHEIFILIDDDNFYLYLDNQDEETYVPAINLKTNYKVNVMNFIYLREWTDYSPKVFNYSNTLTDIIEIINSLV